MSPPSSSSSSSSASSASDDARARAEASAAISKCYHVYGYGECGLFRSASVLATQVQRCDASATAVAHEVGRARWPEHLHALKQAAGARAAQHATCPVVVEGCNGMLREWIGGYSEFLERAKSHCQKGAASK